MNHPSREFCRGCGAELVYNPMRPRFGAYPRSQGGKFVTLAALSLVFLAAAGIGLYSLGEFDALIASTIKSLTENSRENELKGREIWDKHLELSGEKDKPPPKSIVMKGDATVIPKIEKIKGVIPKYAPPVPTINGNMEYYYKAPGKIYSRVQFNVPANERGRRETVIVQKLFDGETGWEKKTRFEPQIKLDGEIVKDFLTETTEQLSAEAVEELKNEMFSRMTNGYTSMQYGGNASVDGKPSYCLRAKKANGLTDTLYVDAETFLVSKVEFEMKPGSDPEKFVKDITFSSYRAVNNMQTPFSMYMSAQNMFLHTTLTEVSFDAEIDDGIFQLK